MKSQSGRLVEDKDDRNHVRRSQAPRLEHLRAKLQEDVINETFEQQERTIEEAAGKIDTKEPDVIQAMRRALRLNNKEWNTEKAYVGKVYAFMRDRSIKSLADFEAIGSSDVEAHLTDLVVDGDVWLWDADQRMPAVACQGHRLRSNVDRDSQFQGKQKSICSLARTVGRTASSPGRGSSSNA